MGLAKIFKTKEAIDINRYKSAIHQRLQKTGYLEFVTNKIMGFGSKKASIVSETRSLDYRNGKPLRSLDLRGNITL